MIFLTLIDSKKVEDNLDNDYWVVVDCRFSLEDTRSGYSTYEESHIPGAVYAHLDDDLCGPPLTDKGRHPLPSTEAMVALFGKLGINPQSQVVVYDASNNAFASRLWWMLRFMGHTAVAVLDGGWDAWQREGFPVRGGVEQNEPTKYSGAVQSEWLVQIEDIDELPLLIDSRAPDRHRGEIEPIDPVAGHIPGSKNYFYQQNLDKDGYFLPAEVLKGRFEQLFGNIPVGAATFYCGSGVTACVNLLAVEHSGLGSSRLYVGSWGEWCRDPTKPIASGG